MHKFARNKEIERIGEKAGFASAYFLFTSMMFLFLSITKKLPAGWGYLNIMLITLGVSSIGIMLERYMHG